MKNKTKSQLNKMTKKNLLLHVEKLQLMIENDHLHNQKDNRELAKVVDTYRIHAAAGKLRRNIFKLKLSVEDRNSVVSLVDSFIDSL